MVYADSSALIKRYLEEPGTEHLNEMFDSAAAVLRPIATSALSYAEIHAALARKLKDKTLRATDFHWAVARFKSDWKTCLTIVELSPKVLAVVPDLVKRHPLTGSDAVQLASAVWLRDSQKLGKEWQGTGGGFVFATSDKQLARAAEEEEIKVFNPEATV